MDRISERDYYLSVVDAIRKRGTCGRGQAGAIIVKSGRILSTGYAGAPSGLPHCDEIDHDIWVTYPKENPEAMTYHCLNTVHAELNAIIQAARYGPCIDGATLYCSMFPCRSCAGAIINAGIRNVIAMKDYQASGPSKKMFVQAGITFEIVISEVQDYATDPRRLP